MVIGSMLLVMFVSTLPLYADDGNVLTLESAIERGFRNSPQAKAVHSRLGVAEAQVITAGTMLNPSVLSDNGIAEETYRLGLQHTFELGGKRKKRVLVARAQQEVVQAEIQESLLALRAELRKAYARLYYARERRQVSEEILKRIREIAEASAAHGTSSDSPEREQENLQAEMDILRAENLLQEALNEETKARNGLNLYLRDPSPASWTLVAPGSPASLKGDATELNSLAETALSQRPELQVLGAGFTQHRQELSLARRNRIPNLTLAAGPDLVVGEEGTLNAFIIGTMELPVFNRQQGPIQEALARQNQLVLERDALKARIVAEVGNAYEDFISLQARVKRYETGLLPKARTLAEKINRDMEAGKVKPLSSMRIRHAYLEIMLEYLQALQNYQDAVSELERAVGASL